MKSAPDVIRHPTAWSQFAYRAYACERFRHVEELEVQLQCLAVDITGNPSTHEGVQFACKEEPIRKRRIIKWRLSEAVSCQQKALGGGVPYGKCKHATKTGYPSASVLLVQMNQH